MQVAIIGAGFVGKQLAKRLMLSGHKPIVLDTVDPGIVGCQHIVIDILKDSLTLPEGIDAVFYLAQSPFYRNFPDEVDQLFGVNVLGAIKSVEAARKAGSRFFFYASTGNVYTPSFELLSETSPVSRDNAYAISKLSAEDSLRLYRPWMQVCIGRLFAVFGPGQTKMLPSLLRDRVLSGQAITLEPGPEGDQDGLRISFILNSDLADCLTVLAEKSIIGQKTPELLNIGGARDISLREFASEIGRQLGKKPIFKMSESQRKCDLRADITCMQYATDLTHTAFPIAIRSFVEAR